jgi:hypothetical protein
MPRASLASYRRGKGNHTEEVPEAPHPIYCKLSLSPQRGLDRLALASEMRIYEPPRIHALGPLRVITGWGLTSPNDEDSRQCHLAECEDD